MSPAATVKAIRYHGNQDVRVEHIPANTKPLGEGEVRLAPAWAGICGTDVGQYVAGPSPGMISTHEHPHPFSKEETPLVWGHEFSAVVTETHPSVTALKVGARVAIEPCKADGTCAYCLEGAEHFCSGQYLYGLHANGGMVESLIQPANKCFELPDDVGLKIGALVEPLAVAWQGIVASGIQKGQTALVIGTGSIGLATVAVLKAWGFQRIVASGRSEGRNKVLEGWGVEAVLNSEKEDVAARTKKIFDGLGAHAVFDSACTQASVDTGLGALRSGGVFHTFGFYHEKISVDINQMLMACLRITTHILYSKEIFPAIILAFKEGKFDKKLLESLITTHVIMDDFLEKGIKDLVKNKAAHIKILVEINPEKSRD